MYSESSIRISARKGWHMAEVKTFILKVPTTTVVEQSFECVPITDFFDKEDRERGYITGYKLVAEGLVSETAQRDSQLAKEQGILDGVDYMVFVGKDRVWDVWQYGGRLYRGVCSLDDGFSGHCWVARPRK
jgi:hypothetical protein